MIPIRAISSLVVGCLFLVTLVGCTEELVIIDDLGELYIPDTTLNQFAMEDENGITITFSEANWGDHYGSMYSYYSMRFASSLYRIAFDYAIHPDSDHYHFRMSWGMSNSVYAAGDIYTGAVTEDESATVTITDSVEVKGVTYHNVVEVDFSKIEATSDVGDVKKVVLSGRKGLVRYELFNGVVLERVPGSEVYDVVPVAQALHNGL